MPKLQKGKLVKCSDSAMVYLTSIMNQENLVYTKFDDNTVFLKNENNEIDAVKQKILLIQDEVADKKPINDLLDKT